MLTLAIEDIVLLFFFRFACRAQAIIHAGALIFPTCRYEATVLLTT
jgi:hypothetical protein